MNRTQLYRDAELIVIRRELAALWANVICNAGGNSVQLAKRLAKETLDEVEATYERIEGASPAKHETIQSILHHEEAFWRLVEQQIESRQ